MFRIGKVIERVDIEEMAERGRCVARVDGKVLFVQSVAPGDVVDVKIVAKRSGYAEAVSVHVHQLNADRTSPFCAHFQTCGGCQWQHVRYAAQAAHKEQRVREVLMRIGQVPEHRVAPIIQAPNTENYRNKLEFTFSNKRWLSSEEVQDTTKVHCRDALGFHRARCFDRIVDIERCHLQPDPSNALRNALKAYAQRMGLSFYDIGKQKGFLRTLTVRTTRAGQSMAVLQFGDNQTDRIQETLDYVVQAFPQLTSLQYVVNLKKNSTFYDLPVHLRAGSPFLTEYVDGLAFRIGAKSFFQTNTFQVETLCRQVSLLADLQPNELLYDLYTGVGTLAITLAKKVRHVVGVDTVEQAIADAQYNAQYNALDNTTFLAGSTESMLTHPDLRKHGRPDVVVLDPPRAGLHPQVIPQLQALSPSRIVYVSCNPATQARDLSHLSTQYELIAAQPIDMFPHTGHVENIALLHRRKL